MFVIQDQTISSGMYQKLLLNQQIPGEHLEVKQRRRQCWGMGF